MFHKEAKSSIDNLTKKQTILFFFLCLFSLSFTRAFAQNPLVFIFDKPLQSPLILQNKIYFAPLQPLARALNLTIKKEDIILNKKEIKRLAFKKNKEIFVPLKTFAAASGCKFLYNTQTGIINIIPGKSPLSQRIVKKLQKKTSVESNQNYLIGSIGHSVDIGNMVLYIPGYYNKKVKHPLVIALSPVGDPYSMIKAWQTAADNHQWFIAASKLFHNGPTPVSLFHSMEEEVKKIESIYPINPSEIIASGFSGGGMGSQMFAFYFPSFIRAVVTNTGMINRSFYQEKAFYPHSKLCVFIASPTDFRFTDMKEDRKFLESLGWSTDWIQFSGGHTIAPSWAYEKAAEWLESNF
ncbi:MAG: hypothetical protein M1421_07810 [Candidatus Eremiobacteraeota bacterium]|nr:hypothetical protein [Candidatus Eremiobacteraeota bacterium]